jgi:hypothetical protein
MSSEPPVREPVPSAPVGSQGCGPTLSAASLTKARATLEDFVVSYFMFHGLTERDFLCFMDVLYFMEASLYEADELCEEAIADVLEGLGSDCPATVLSKVRAACAHVVACTQPLQARASRAVRTPPAATH